MDICLWRSDMKFRTQMLSYLVVHSLLFLLLSHPRLAAHKLPGIFACFYPLSLHRNPGITGASNYLELFHVVPRIKLRPPGFHIKSFTH